MMVVRRMLLVIGSVVAAMLLFVALLWFFQRHLVYFPTQAVAPAGAVLPGGEEVTFVTADGLRLAGWFMPAAGGTGRPLTVLMCNGNGGNRSFRAPLATALARAGLSVFLFDYRGYGGNPGNPSEVGLLADARAARAYLVARDDVDPDRLVYLGESLGAAVAVALAVEQPPAALILRSPFSSLVDMARLHYPWLPVDLLLWDRYPSVEQIDRVAAPLLVVAGEQDRVVPAAQSRRLYERAAAPKRLVMID